MTKAAGHTPGPWFIRERPTDDGLAVIEDGRQNGLFPITCEWSEAPLIAAAPDLLEALEDLLLSCADDDSEMKFIPQSNVEAARAAIARAKGEA